LPAHFGGWRRTAGPPAAIGGMTIATLLLFKDEPQMFTTTALNEIKAHIDERGGDYRNWYAGIAADAQHRLFNDHNVDKANGQWIYRNAGSNTAARQAEDALHRLGCKGGPGGGDGDTRFVYAYRITPTTIE
jgi:hypothetical protein